MFKKGISLILTTAFAMMLSTAVFAGIQLNPVEKGDIILIEPQIGSERQVFVKESMAISIRSEGDYPVDVSLYKMMPSARDSYLDDACDSEMILGAKDVPFKVISGGSIVTKDAVIDYERADDETIERLDELNISDEELESNNIIDGTEALLQTEKLSSKDRQSVIKAFKNARRDFEKNLSNLEDEYDVYMETFPEGHEAGYSYSDSEMDIIKTYLYAVVETEKSCIVYNDAQNDYEAIFEIPLFGPEDLTDTGILPYYQKTVEKISPGLYKFVFSDQDTREIIEVIEFEVSKKEELTEEDIKELVPSALGDLLIPATEEEEEPEVDEKEELKIESKPLIEERPEDKMRDSFELNETQTDDTEKEDPLEQLPTDDNTEE